MKYALFFLVLITASCKREKLQQSVELTVQSLLNKYQLVEVEPELEKIKSALANKPLFARIKHQLDFSNLQAYHSTVNSSIVYIISFHGQPDKKYAVHASTGKQLQILDEIMYSKKMSDKENGDIGILKNDGAIRINFTNGQLSISELHSTEYKLRFTREPFCQRKEGQSFKDCYKQETDEFCDSFVSCIALATNPTVSILIAVACSCSPD